MFSHSRALIAAALVIGFAAPAMAQQSMRHYLDYFKYSDAAMKAMTENPTDREAGLHQARMMDSLCSNSLMTSPQWP
jgi:uncharacterized lipoprotein